MNTPAADAFDAMNDQVSTRLSPKRLAKYQKLMERFDAYVETNLTDPLYNDDCARALGVSARSLANVVKGIHGVSTQRYVRTRRLNAVRDALMAAGRPCQIKQIARAHGFVHLGEFCSEYRKQFGELPSETRASVDPRISPGALEAARATSELAEIAA
jgi:transcriptional regulator GlxA family with amidase domain